MEVAIRRSCLVLALVCAGCSTHGTSAAPSTAPSPPPSSATSPDTSAASSAATASPPVPPTTSAPASPTAVSAPPPGLNPPSGPPLCASRALTLTVRAGDSGAGQFHQQLLLANSGGPCTLTGYPGVSFLDSAGHTLGSPAAHSPGPVRRQTLAAGGSVAAVLTYSNAAAYPEPACRPRQSSRVRVYPPGERQALLAPDAVLVCSAPGTAQLHIGPVEAVG